MFEGLDLEGYQAFIGLATAVLGVLGLTTKKVQGLFKAAFLKLLKYHRRSRDMEKALQEVLANQAKGFEVVGEITYELKTNGGGSIKDAVNRIETSVNKLTSIDSYRYRKLPYPGFECTKEGFNTRVTDAYLTLLDLKVNDDLNSLDWNRFIHSDDFDAYFNAFKRASASGSDFGYPTRLYNNRREPLGLWYISGELLECGTYMGRFQPSCDRSRKIADDNKWEV